MSEVRAYPPTDLTAQKILTIKKSLKNGATIARACEEAGLSRDTFWRWRTLNGNKKEIDEILESRVSIVEDCLYQNCLKGKEGSIFFFLTRRAGDRWPDQAKFQQQFGNNIKFEILDYKQAAKVCEEIKRNEDSQRQLSAS